jgi:hypothetical protein
MRRRPRQPAPLFAGVQAAAASSSTGIRQQGDGGVSITMGSGGLCSTIGAGSGRYRHRRRFGAVAIVSATECAVWAASAAPPWRVPVSSLAAAQRAPDRSLSPFPARIDATGASGTACETGGASATFCAATPDLLSQPQSPPRSRWRVQNAAAYPRRRQRRGRQALVPARAVSSAEQTSDDRIFAIAVSAPRAMRLACRAMSATCMA